MEAFFEFWFGCADFFGGSLAWERKYPRWLRRLYIITWPIAVVLRFFLLLFFAMSGLALIFILGAPIAAFYWCGDKIEDLTRHIRKQWMLEPENKAPQ